MFTLITLAWTGLELLPHAAASALGPVLVLVVASRPPFSRVGTRHVLISCSKYHQKRSAATQAIQRHRTAWSFKGDELADPVPGVSEQDSETLHRVLQ